VAGWEEAAQARHEGAQVSSVHDPTSLSDR
jgi:hypothetical protein